MITVVRHAPKGCEAYDGPGIGFPDVCFSCPPTVGARYASAALVTIGAGSMRFSRPLAGSFL